MIDVDYDDKNLWGLVQALSMRDRVRIFRGAMRKSANDLKRLAGDILIRDLKNVRDRSALKKTIWTKVYTRTAGFRVTVAGNAHLYPSRMRNKSNEVRELPLGRWLEEGATDRKTRKGGYARGSLPAIKFLGRANEQLEPRISEMLEEHYFEYVTKEAKKYGCI